MNKTSIRFHPLAILRLRPSFSAILLVLLAIFYCAPIWAHTKLLLNSDVPPRYDNDGIKGSDPCGVEGGTKTDKISVYPRGATVRIDWKETINHVGYFEIDFSTDGGATFSNSSTVPDPSTSSKHDFSLAYTFPDQLCGVAGCILRLRQFMQSGSGGSFYFSCADVSLVDPDATPQPPATMPNISDDMNNVTLAWTNPNTFKGILVLRNTQDQFSGLAPNDLTVYHSGEVIGGAEILFKSENGETQFSDSQFYGDSDYYYAVYAYSDSYVYSTPVVSSVHTAPGSGLGDVPTASPGTSNDDGGGGAGDAYLLLLFILIAISHYRYRGHRKVRLVRQNKR